MQSWNSRNRSEQTFAGHHDWNDHQSSQILEMGSSHTAPQHSCDPGSCLFDFTLNGWRCDKQTPSSFNGYFLAKDSQSPPNSCVLGIHDGTASLCTLNTCSIVLQSHVSIQIQSSCLHSPCLRLPHSQSWRLCAKHSMNGYWMKEYMNKGIELLYITVVCLNGFFITCYTSSILNAYSC